MKLSNFFVEKNRDGPCNSLNFVGRPRELQKLATAIFERWEAAATAAAKRVKPTDEAIAVLKDHKREKAPAHMDRARKLAAEAMRAKRAKRTITLDTST